MVAVMAARKPVESHCTWSCPRPKAPMMSGSATLTMVEAAVVAMVPSMTVTVANHLYPAPKRAA